MFESEKVPYFGELFSLFSNGKHLNRLRDPRLWASLVAANDEYTALFLALGYSLRIDNRGFAYFNMESHNAQANQTNRRMAFLFLILFDHFKDTFLTVDFTQLAIDSKVSAALSVKHKQILEQMDIDTNLDLLINPAKRYNLLEVDDFGILRMMPAVWRYFDAFKAIYEQNKANDESLVTPPHDTDAVETIDLEDEEFTNE